MGIRNRSAARHIGPLLVGTVLASITLSASPQFSTMATAQQPEATYVGVNKCAACHFAQFRTWKTSRHGQAFQILPTKYKEDAECLQCHTTGTGAQADDEPAAGPTGIACEACHGPGSIHSKLALKFVDQGITEAGEKELRAAIQKNSINQCVKCHVSKAHGTHPPYDPEPGTSALPKPNRPRSRSFFQVHDVASADN